MGWVNPGIVINLKHITIRLLPGMDKLPLLFLAKESLGVVTSRGRTKRLLDKHIFSENFLRRLGRSKYEKPKLLWIIIIF